MRILEVSRYKKNTAGGISPFVYEQGEAIRALGHEVDYFLVKGNYLKAVRPLKEKIREYKPDIVHAHFGLSAITAELQNMVPVVTTFHNGETLNWYVNLASSLMSLRAKHVIYVAQHIRDLSYFKAKNYSIIPCGVPMKQMTIIPKEEARKQLGWDADKKYILFGGAFDNLRKNHPLLRDAIALLYSTKTQINVAFDKWVVNDQTTPLIGRDDHCLRSPQELEIIGDPIGEVIKNAHSTSVSSNSPHGLACNQPQVLTSELAAPVIANTPNMPTDESHVECLQKNIDSINLENNEKQYSWTQVEGGGAFGDVVCIEMKGLSRAECVLRMNACDLFALPSHSEGSPQALKEAMAVNCPCMATDIADVRYLFGDEPGHWILRNPRKTHERWDADEKSLDEMVDLLKEALAFEGRTNGRKRILELGLSNEQVAERIVKIYESIAK